MCAAQHVWRFTLACPRAGQQQQLQSQWLGREWRGPDNPRKWPQHSPVIVLQAPPGVQ